MHPLSAHDAHSAERGASSDASDALGSCDGAPLPLLLRTLLDHCTSDTKPAERGSCSDTRSSNGFGR